MTGSEEDLEVSEETVAAQPDLPGMPEPESPTSEERAAAERDALLATVRSTLSPAVQDAIATAVRVYGALDEPDNVEAFGAWIAALPR